MVRVLQGIVLVQAAVVATIGVYSLAEPMLALICVVGAALLATLAFLEGKEDPPASPHLVRRRRRHGYPPTQGSREPGREE